MKNIAYASISVLKAAGRWFAAPMRGAAAAAAAALLEKAGL